MLFPFLFFLLSISAYKSTKDPIKTLRNQQSPFQIGLSRYEDFILRSDRNYDIFILFVSFDPDHYCERCEELLMYYRATSAMYKSKVKEEERDCFFAVADYEEDDQLFERLRVRMIPTVMYFPRYINFNNRKIDSDYMFQVDDEPLDELLHWIFGMADISMDAITGTELDDSGEPQVKPTLYFYSTAITILYGLMLCYFSSLNRTFYSLYQNPKLYRFFTLFVYGMSICGTASCIINDTPWFYNNPYARTGDEQMIFIANEGMSQYVLEGFLGALHMIIIAFGLHRLYQIKLDEKNDYIQLSIACLWTIVVLFTYEELSSFVNAKLMSGAEEEGIFE